MVSANGPALEPLGLSYQEFITAGDVQILNSNTTMISVSINSMNEETVQKAVYEYYSKDAEMQAYMAKIRCRRRGQDTADHERAEGVVLN